MLIDLSHLDVAQILAALCDWQTEEDPQRFVEALDEFAALSDVEEVRQ